MSTKKITKLQQRCDRFSGKLPPDTADIVCSDFGVSLPKLPPRDRLIAEQLCDTCRCCPRRSRQPHVN